MPAVDEFGREIKFMSGATHRHHHHHHHRDPSPSPPTSRIGEKRSRRHYYSDRDYHHSYSHSHRSSERRTSSGSRDGGGSSSRRSRLVERYVSEPMLCEYVWKDQQQKRKKEMELSKDDEEETTKDDSAPTTTEEDNSGATTIKEEETMTTTEASLVTTEEPSTEETTYDDYRKEYGLNYVRAFFNEHLDDSWFRAQYSPLWQKRIAQQHLVLANLEAKEILKELNGSNKESFLKNVKLGHGTKGGGTTPAMTNITSSSYRSNNIPPSSSASTSSINNNNNRVPTSHLTSHVQKNLVVKLLDIPPHVTDDQITQALLDHLNTSTTGGAAANANNNNNTNNVSTNPADPDDCFQLFGSLDLVNTTDTLLREAYCIFTSRELLEECLSSILSKNTQQQNQQQQQQQGAAANVPRKEDAINKLSKHKILELDVECSDPYGRMELEDDSGSGGGATGGENADGTTTTTTAVPPRKATIWLHYPPPNNNNKSSTTTSNTTTSPPVVVLSAALSTKSRLSSDKNAAIWMARALDVKRKISRGHRLDDIMEVVLQDDDDDELQLDLALCYLRRVHLFSLYGGCITLSTYAQLLAGQLPIHLRLENADELLLRTTTSTTRNITAPTTNRSTTTTTPIKMEEGGVEETSTTTDNDNAAEESADGETMTTSVGEEQQEGGEQQQQVKQEPGTSTSDDVKTEDGVSTTKTPTATPAVSDDLLVRRLDDAIQAAMEESQDKWVNDDSIVSTEVDELALELSEEEKNVQKKWIESHSLHEEERARCSFSFCRKLFKDSKFLKKHLLKKHSEYLRAEVAKCHDVYMMKSWDAVQCRPVPPIYVDCGHVFGHVRVPVLGAEHPMAKDPEPELWKREEERRSRRQELQAQQQQAAAQAGSSQRQASSSNRRDYDASSATSPPGGPRNRHNTNFVDVDDMQEEKIEISFGDADTMDVPVQPPKKKKRKKKLL